ncbi:hypothetical protein GCM10011498_10570 [Amylibacter cionae]|uniref:Uncharacterized protein n=1 Tax=Neptunicoccus cionae TaxID=2035344 RepID=A0A916QUM8_9RHOB|nr:hypothetical protein GCM10011498_10570 [Amylibacter cionae]
MRPAPHPVSDTIGKQTLIPAAIGDPKPKSSPLPPANGITPHQKASFKPEITKLRPNHKTALDNPQKNRNKAPERRQKRVSTSHTRPVQ